MLIQHRGAKEVAVHGWIMYVLGSMAFGVLLGTIG